MQISLQPANLPTWHTQIILVFNKLTLIATSNLSSSQQTHPYHILRFYDKSLWSYPQIPMLFDNLTLKPILRFISVPTSSHLPHPKFILLNKPTLITSPYFFPSLQTHLHGILRWPFFWTTSTLSHPQITLLNKKLTHITSPPSREIHPYYILIFPSCPTNSVLLYPHMTLLSDKLTLITSSLLVPTGLVLMVFVSLTACHGSLAILYNILSHCYSVITGFLLTIHIMGWLLV